MCEMCFNIKIAINVRTISFLETTLTFLTIWLTVLENTLISKGWLYYRAYSENHMIIVFVLFGSYTTEYFQMILQKLTKTSPVVANKMSDIDIFSTFAIYHFNILSFRVLSMVMEYFSCEYLVIQTSVCDRQNNQCRQQKISPSFR